VLLVISQDYQVFSDIFSRLGLAYIVQGILAYIGFHVLKMFNITFYLHNKLRVITNSSATDVSIFIFAKPGH
jgi:hypothetical protein